jgi:pimeloyl-ACP methyl ester carboxylesterase
MESAGYVKVEGGSIAYARFGKSLDVLLVHGIPTNRTLWHGVIPRLIEAGLGGIAVDLLGYGASDKCVGQDLGVAAQARYLEQLLPSIGWERGLLVGHDIGGGIVQLLAVNSPTVATGLVLVDTIAYDSFPEPGIARLQDPAWDAILSAPDFSLTKGLAKGFRKGLANPDLVTPELLARYEMPFAGATGRLAYLRAARALRTDELASRMKEIEALALPALIVWGEQDQFQPLAYGERLAEAMENARFEVISGSGHFLPEDSPTGLADRIVRLNRQIHGAE